MKVMVSWMGDLFWTYNPAKIIKYDLLLRMVYESKTGYICNMELYTGAGKNRMIILALLKQYLQLEHYICQDNYYNGVSIAETLYKKYPTNVCKSN